MKCKVLENLILKDGIQVCDKDIRIVLVLRSAILVPSLAAYYFTVRLRDIPCLDIENTGFPAIRICRISSNIQLNIKMTPPAGSLTSLDQNRRQHDSAYEPVRKIGNHNEAPWTPYCTSCG